MHTIPNFLMDPRVKDAVSAIGSALRAALPDGKFGEREAQALAVSNEAVREFLREELQELADSFGEDVLVDGEPYRLHEPGADTYHSLCGPLPVSRPSYRKVGIRNGPIVIGLELSAGLVEGATPALGYSVAHGYAQDDMRAHCKRYRPPIA